VPTRSYGWPQTTVHRWTPLAWSGWTAVRGQSTGCRRRGDLTPPKTATASGTGASNAVEFVDAVEQISRADRAHRKTPRLRLLSSTGRFGSVAGACVVSMNCPARVEPGDGQESVWDHPWSPRIEPACRQLRVVLGEVTIADTVSGLRVLETSHPPNHFFPSADITPDALIRNDGSSWCEWKGQARNPTARGADRVERNAAWSYPTPNPDLWRAGGDGRVLPSVDGCLLRRRRTGACSRAGSTAAGLPMTWSGPFKRVPGTNWW